MLSALTLATSRSHLPFSFPSTVLLASPCCRHDLFNVRLRLARFLDDDVRYKLFGLGAAGEAVTPLKSSVPYRGPALGQLRDDITGSMGARCVALLEVPGLLEGRPVLVMGDSVHIRMADSPTVDYQATVLATSASTVFLCMPNAFWGNARVATLLPAMGASGLPSAEKGNVRMPGSTDVFDGLVLVRFG